MLSLLPEASPAQIIAILSPIVTRCRHMLSLLPEASPAKTSPAMAQPHQAKSSLAVLSHPLHGFLALCCCAGFLLSCTLAIGKSTEPLARGDLWAGHLSHIRSHSCQSTACIQCPASRVQRWLVAQQRKMACLPTRTTSRLTQRTMLQTLPLAWLQQQHVLAAFREQGQRSRLPRGPLEPLRDPRPRDCRCPNGLPGQARHHQARGQGCRCQSRVPFQHGPRPHGLQQ